MAKVHAPRERKARGRNIGLWLDTYDDIFSDFDPRPYEERTISDDFLSELQKMVREDPEGVAELQLQIPEEQRDAPTEEVIVQRIHDYFGMKHEEMESALRRLRRNALIMTCCGMLLSLAAGWLAFFAAGKLPMSLLLVILEPAGWFLIWNGLDTLYSSVRSKKPQLEFYGKMTRCKIVFEKMEE